MGFVVCMFVRLVIDCLGCWFILWLWVCRGTGCVVFGGFAFSFIVLADLVFW